MEKNFLMYLKKMTKSAWYFIRRNDWIWGLPIAIMGFFGYGVFQETIFGDPMFGTEWFHRAMLAGIILMLFDFFITGWMNLKHRGLTVWYYDKKSGIREEFKKLPSWVKVFVYPFYYFLMLFILVLLMRMIAPLI